MVKEEYILELFDHIIDIKKDHIFALQKLKELINEVANLKEEIERLKMR